MAGRVVVSTLNDDTGVLQTQNGMTGIAKAWVNFDGSTGTIRSSFNVGSVTKNSQGDYTINYSTAMPNTNYAAVGSAGRNGTGGSNFLCDPQYYAPATGSQRFVTFNYSGGGLVDPPIVAVAVFSS